MLQVSTLVYLMYKATMESTFENLCLERGSGDTMSARAHRAGQRERKEAVSDLGARTRHAQLCPDVPPGSGAVTGRNVIGYQTLRDASGCQSSEATCPRNAEQKGVTRSDFSAAVQKGVTLRDFPSNSYAFRATSH